MIQRQTSCSNLRTLDKIKIALLIFLELTSNKRRLPLFSAKAPKAHLKYTDNNQITTPNLLYSRANYLNWKRRSTSLWVKYLPIQPSKPSNSLLVKSAISSNRNRLFQQLNKKKVQFITTRSSLKIMEFLQINQLNIKYYNQRLYMKKKQK